MNLLDNEMVVYCYTNKINNKNISVLQKINYQKDIHNIYMIAKIIEIIFLFITQFVNMVLKILI